jgi:hypothetical protein
LCREDGGYQQLPTIPMVQRHRGMGIHLVEAFEDFAQTGGTFGGCLGFGYLLGRRGFPGHAAIIARLTRVR